MITYPSGWRVFTVDGALSHRCQTDAIRCESGTGGRLMAS
jgi:hypothetical protein